MTRSRPRSRAGTASGSSALPRYVLLLALALPVVIVGLSVNLVAGTSFASPSAAGGAAAVGQPLLSKRPIGLQAAVPPTLTAPTSTPVPTSTPAPVVSPTPRVASYTVKPGDELKHIAASYGIDIFALIRANNIPDPDSLRVGQVLKIPG